MDRGHSKVITTTEQGLEKIGKKVEALHDAQDRKDNAKIGQADTLINLEEKVASVENGLAKETMI